MSSSLIKQSSSSFSFVFELSTMFFMVVHEFNTMFSVGLIDSVAAQMFPNKQIHADLKDCPTIAELFLLKQKEQTIKTETRKQKDQSQNNQLP